MNVIRSVQCASFSPINAGGAATNLLVTTITFRAIGLGVTTIDNVILTGDTGPLGDTAGNGASVTVTVVPEPGSALLLGLGLTGLGLVGRRGRWDRERHA